MSKLSLLALSVLFLLFIPRAQAHAIEVKVSAPHLNYEFKASPAKFELTRLGETKQLEIRPCNKGHVDFFLRQFDKQWSHHKTPPKAMLAKKLISVAVGKRKAKVNPRSQFGKWLKTGADKAQVVFMSARESCK